MPTYRGGRGKRASWNLVYGFPLKRTLLPAPAKLPETYRYLSDNKTVGTVGTYNVHILVKNQ